VGTVGTAGFIANTDFGWFSHFLHRAEPPDEVDFWQPSPHGFKAIRPGAPFLFRLGAPHKAIAGYGFFARCERVPVWLAWESFGDKNGTDTFAEMAARIEAIRRRTGSALLARPQDYEVGCIMISQPVFFPRDDWVADHADWHLHLSSVDRPSDSADTSDGQVHQMPAGGPRGEEDQGRCHLEDGRGVTW